MARAAAARFADLLDALAREPDPPTTIRLPQEAVERHLADSLCGLEVRELRNAGRIADVGSGAGFPGLALAAALPRARVELLESSARKCAVIERLARAAQIENARAVARRAEEWAAAEGAEAYDAVTARAVGPLALVVEYAAPLLRSGGMLVAWKGARQEAEEAAAALAAALVGLEQVDLRRVEPFDTARERHLHVYAKVAPTPARFPRRPGMARKRPLA